MRIQSIYLYCILNTPIVSRPLSMLRQKPRRSRPSLNCLYTMHVYGDLYAWLCFTDYVCFDANQYYLPSANLPSRKWPKLLLSLRLGSFSLIILSRKSLLTHSLAYLLTHSKPVATEAPKVEETKEAKAADVDKPAPVAAKPDVYVLCICSVVTVFYTIVALILKPNHRFIQFILITI